MIVIFIDFMAYDIIPYITWIVVHPLYIRQITREPLVTETTMAFRGFDEIKLIFVALLKDVFTGDLMNYQPNTMHY